MNKKGISFFKGFKTRLKLSIESVEGELDANLEIRKNKLPILKIDGFSSTAVGDIELSEKEKNSIKCRSDFKGYTLIGCESNGALIYPQYVVEGINNEQFHGVEIALTGFSTWFDQYTHFEITDTEIKKNLPDKKFNVVVDINGERYQFSSNFCCNIKNFEKRDFLVSEYTTIKVVKVNGCITANAAEELAHDVRRLFSLLLGQPLSMEYVWLIVGEKKARRSFYFCCAGNSEEPFEYPRECLIHPALIFERDMWSGIFKRYYSPPTRKNFQKIWYRLPALFEYSGTWEYELLGYVSILDAYSDQFSDKKKLNSSDYCEVKQELLSVIDKFQEKLGEEYCEIMDSFKNGINGIKNTDLPTFKEKFSCMMSGIDESVRDMINFSDEEFSAIKRVRDSAAHGQPVKTRDERDISFEFGIKYKLQVLLLYLVYRDFGFNPIDYAICLKRTFGKYVRNAEINKLNRDKLTALVPFYEVELNSFIEASKSNKFYVAIVYIKSGDIYRYNAMITKEIQDNWLKNTDKVHRNLVDHIKDFLANTGVIDVEFVSQVYLSCGDKNLELSGVCLITYESDPV